MPRTIIRPDGSRWIHTSLDIPETIYNRVKESRISISQTVTDVLTERFGETA